MGIISSLFYFWETFYNPTQFLYNSCYSLHSLLPKSCRMLIFSCTKSEALHMWHILGFIPPNLAEKYIIFVAWAWKSMSWHYCLEVRRMRPISLRKNSSYCYLLNMCDEVLVVLRGKADTLDVFSGDMTDCIPAEVPSLLKTDILDQ